MFLLIQACATFFTNGPHLIFGKLSRVASIFIGWNFIHSLKNKFKLPLNRYGVYGVISSV